MMRRPTLQSLFFIFATLILLLLSGCQKDSKDFQILLFTELPTEAEETIQSIVYTYNKGDKKVEVHIHPPMYEKLIVEVVDHSGDIILLEKELLSSIFDSGGLYPLDELVTGDKVNVDEFQLKDEEGNTHIYALPVPVESTLLKEYHFNESKEIVGIIPIYTKNKEMAHELLETLVNSK
jgi:maltose-binding protein MalE